MEASLLLWRSWIGWSPGRSWRSRRTVASRVSGARHGPTSETVRRLGLHPAGYGSGTSRWSVQRWTTNSRQHRQPLPGVQSTGDKDACSVKGPNVMLGPLLESSGCDQGHVHADGGTTGDTAARESGHLYITAA